jgi:hypothetical protein
MPKFSMIATVVGKAWGLGCARSNDQQRRRGRIVDEQVTGEVVPDLPGRTGRTAGPRSHSSTILPIVCSSTIFDRVFQGVNCATEVRRTGRDVEALSRRDPAMSVIRARTWSAQPSQDCVRPAVGPSKNTYVVNTSIADRPQRIALSHGCRVDEPVCRAFDNKHD